MRNGLVVMGDVRRLNMTSAMFGNRVLPPEEALPPAVPFAALGVPSLSVHEELAPSPATLDLAMDEIVPPVQTDQ